MRTCCISCVCLGMLCMMAPVAAQDKPVTVGIGYQFLAFDDSSFPLGLNLDVGAALTEQFALIGEVGWSRDAARQFGLRDITTAFHAGGGLRWSTGRDRRVGPFGQIVVGSERDTVDIEEFGRDSQWKSLLQPGAGIVIRINRRQALFGQVDLRRVFHEGDRANAVRFLIGARFHIQ